MAADNAPPALAKPGAVLFEDDFSRPDLKPKWNVGKVSWSVKDGVVSAAENPVDHHAAYAYIAPNIDFKDAVAEFAFRFDGNNNVQLNLRDSRYKDSHAGHIVRVQIELTAVQLADWKTGVMKNENYEKISDPKTDPAVKKEIQQKIKDKSARFKVSFDPAAWHTEGKAAALERATAGKFGNGT